MEIKVLEKKDNELRFEISGINESEANTLRRLIISETPTLSIDEIEFIKNDSGLYDEILANRLGLIPLITDLKTYNLPEECTCKDEGCANCQVQATIEIKGPKTVYSEDLEFKDKNIKAVYGKIPIVKLLDGQELKLIVTASLGKGKDHIKNAPAAIFYTNKPILTINNDPKKLEKIKNKFPKKAFTNGKLNEENLLKDNLYESCEGIDDSILKIEYENDKFIFDLESFGQLSSKDILESAINNLDNKLDKFSKALNLVKPTAIKTLAKRITG
jgi:DNA-directed RNA polymerase subunit D